MMFGQSAERISARRVARLVERLAEAAADDVPPDVRVTREGSAVVLSGWRLRVRSIGDAGHWVVGEGFAMSAGEAVRAELVARLRAEAALAGIAVVEAGPGPGVLPRIEVAAPQGIDWSAKDFRGREMRTAVTVRVAAGQHGRMGALAEAVERAGEALDGDIGGWRVAGAVFLRARSVVEKSGSAVLVEHRVRIMEV